MNWGRDVFHRVRVAHIGCAALDAVERVPTFWFKVPVRVQSGRRLHMNLNLVEARSPLRATFVSGERTRAPPPEVHPPV